MITNRIQIINEDLGGAGTTTQAATIGFAVVKAPKGSIEPVFIPANSVSLIHEKLGYTSKDYPGLQEIIDFNSAGYGLYVSAPYDVAAVNKTPVAYVTPAGVLARLTPVTITGSRLEDIEAEELSVEHISTFSADEDVLVPVGREKSYFGVGADVSNVITYEAGDTKKLQFNFAFDISPVNGALSEQAETSYHFLNNAAFNTAEPGRVLRNASAAAGILVIDIPEAAAPVELYLEIAPDNKLYVRDNAGRDLGLVSPDVDGHIHAITLDSAYIRGTGVTGLYNLYFSANAIASTWSSEAFRAGVRVYWKASVGKDAIHATIYQKTLSARTTTLSFSRQQYGNRLGFSAREQVTPSNYASYALEGSLLEGDEDGFGAALDFRSKLAGQGLINLVALKPFGSTTVYTATGTSTGPMITMAPVVLSRGARVVTDASLELGWAEAQDPEMDKVEVFFNPVPLTEAATLFTALANTQKLSRFVGSRTAEPEAATEALPQLSYGKNYYITTNLFVRRSSYTSEEFTSNLSGAYAAMIAKIIDLKLGGAAPMFLNAGEIGGQLKDITVKKAVYKYTPDQLDNLDAACYNPIIKDSAYGVMVVSQRTAKAGEKSDWSYIGHSSAFLKFQREARDSVMFPQLGKANNPYYQSLRDQQIKTLLKARTDGPGRIWAGATVDTVSVNTEAVKQARRFKIAVKVKVDIFSEGVDLNFTNVDQGTVLE